MRTTSQHRTPPRRHGSTRSSRTPCPTGEYTTGHITTTNSIKNNSPHKQQRHRKGWQGEKQRGRVASFLAAAALALTRGVFSCCGGGRVASFLVGAQLLLTYLAWVALTRGIISCGMAETATSPTAGLGCPR
eukprot:scaffold4903_cov142-Skeletonema_menzelii.AAC.6